MLEEYTAKDERVRIFHVPADGSGEGYDHRELCAADNVDRGRWMLFLEPDEFVFSANGISLSHHLQLNCTDTAQLAVDLKLFGASGHRVRPSSLVIESYDKWNKPAVLLSPAVILNIALCEAHLGGACSWKAARALTEMQPMGNPQSVCDAGVLGNKYATKSVEEYLSRIVRTSLLQKSSDTADELAWHALILRLGYNLLRMEDTGAAFSEAIEKTPDLLPDGRKRARQVGACACVCACALHPPVVRVHVSPRHVCGA